MIRRGGRQSHKESDNCRVRFYVSGQVNRCLIVIKNCLHPCHKCEPESIYLIFRHPGNDFSIHHPLTVSLPPKRSLKWGHDSMSIPCFAETPSERLLNPGHCDSTMIIGRSMQSLLAGIREPQGVVMTLVFMHGIPDHAILAWSPSLCYIGGTPNEQVCCARLLNVIM